MADRVSTQIWDSVWYRAIITLQEHRLTKYYPMYQVDPKGFFDWSNLKLKF